MMDIQENSLGKAWVSCIKLVLDRGQIERDEDVKLSEVWGVSIKINNPNCDDAIINKFGDKHIIEHTLEKFSRNVYMPDRPFTYGQRIYDKNGVDQYAWLLHRIKNKKESKSATISLLNEGDLSPNLPCLVTLDCKIRDNKLCLQFFYRSQNVVGRQYANFIALAKFQNDLANDLAVSVGPMSGYIASAHIYDYDMQNARMIVNNEGFELSDKFYECGPKSIREGFKGV